MAKRVDPLKAKAAKQKKMAIGLSVVFVAVLAFQGPKTLKMLKGPGGAAPVAAATTPATTTATDPAAPVTPTIDGVPPTGAAGTPTAGTPQPAVLVDSDVPAAAGEGQLTSFELFAAKDPFAPQGGITTDPGAPSSEKPDTGAAKPADGASVVPPSSGDSGTGSAPPTAPPGTTPPSTPTAARASATSISVNGTAEDVAVDGTFPKAAPAFVLVSAAKDGKSVQIGVAGGTYADGAKTIKLALGKSLTLRNTADGSQYVLLLNVVAGFVPPK